MSPGATSVRIVFMGSPDFAVPFLSALVAQGRPVVGVVTQPDRPSGRGQSLKASPVKTWALSSGLPVRSPDSLRTPSGRAFLEEWAPELIVVVAYGKILPEEVLCAPQWGCLNVHASLLPELRGASPIVWAIRNGETVSGLSLMLLDRGMDTGPVLDRMELPLGVRETTESLTRRMVDAGPAFLLSGIDRYLSGILTPVPQGAGGTLAPMLRKEDGLIPFGGAAAEVDAHVRAMNPWPGAFFHSSMGLIRVGKGGVLEGSGCSVPGTVVAMSREGIDLSCGSGTFRVLDLQREGGRMIASGEFLAGHRFERGEVVRGR